MSRAAWLPAKRNATFSLLFGRYAHWLLRRSFENVWLRRGASALPEHGYVAIANHSSWWDGFVALLLHGSRAGGPFSIMMDNEQLQRFPFFRLGGAFSVSARSQREAHEAVVYAAGEARGGAGVWIFPEGAFSGNDLLPFRSAFAHVARRAGVPIVPVAMRYTMLEHQRPEAFVDIGPPIASDGREAGMHAESEVRARLRGLDTLIAARDRRAFDRSWRRSAGIDDVSARIAGWFPR